ncbi:MAG: hypothetical protein B7Y15_08620 [Bacteroidetes bacterium 24-39-8]|nr:MAG: hypothetical protein B7Y15_08620 [Bacteroidetes bacterium 24-39-8]HQS55278.1 hypothetical protein [Sediminibacterium sp.]
MIDKVFPISSKKLSAFILDEYSIKFSSQRKESFDSFKDEFEKKLTLASKEEVKYDQIKSITKDEDEQELILSFKSSLGLTNELAFNFSNPSDYEICLTYLEKERYFTRSYIHLSPFAAIRLLAFWLIFTIGFTIFSHYQAIDIEAQGVDPNETGKRKSFSMLIYILGDSGVLAIGALVSTFFAYKIWKRYSNPPRQMRLMPPNSF